MKERRHDKALGSRRVRHRPDVDGDVVGNRAVDGMTDISIRPIEPDELGIVTERGKQRKKFARYAYTAPVPPPAPSPELTGVVRAAVEEYMGKASVRKIVERAVTKALSEQAATWRNRRLALQAVSESAERYSIDYLLEIAAQITGVTVDELRTPSRRRRVAWPRHFAIALLHVARRDLSTTQIGKIFGGRDHTTILHALNAQLVRRTYPDCERWYADPRAAKIFAGSEFSSDKLGAER